MEALRAKHPPSKTDFFLSKTRLTLFLSPKLIFFFSLGYTYERSAIEGWLQNNENSPLLNQMKLVKSFLIPNLVLKKLITDWQVP
jgi:hypothetical protein